MPKPLAPIINWNNPLAKGLIFDIPLSERGGIAKEIVAKLTTTFANSPAWINTILGRGVSFNGATSNGPKISFTGNANQTTSASIFSVEVIIFIRTLGGGFGRFFGRSSGGTFRTIWRTENSSGNDRMRFLIAFSGGTNAWNPNFALASNYNTWIHAIVTYDSTNVSNDPIFYFNGKKVSIANTTRTTGTWTSDGTTILIGNQEDNAQAFDGIIALTRKWNRILTPTEAKQLYTNPWQIYSNPIKPALNTGIR